MNRLSRRFNVMIPTLMDYYIMGYVCSAFPTRTIFAAVLLSVGCIGARAASLVPTVAVTGGEIRGAVSDNGVASFKGIPFARPPVGKLRWHEPMPPISWSGIRDVTAFGPPCPQNPAPTEPGAAEISREDCLHLNVWAAGWPSKSRKPVMVWIHGGGNSIGSSARPTWDGEALARRGVVVVSANYRLGALGFMAHPDLTKESRHQSSGNYGILDQIAALRWVHKNIAAFGGDPANTTIFGVSSGSLDVSALMTSPLARGLFTRVIAQSGAVVGMGIFETLPQAEKRGLAFAASLGLAGRGRLEALRSTPVSEILKAFVVPRSAPSRLISATTNLGIVTGTYVFPKDPSAVFARGEQHRVALMLGSNAASASLIRSLLKI